MRNQKVGADPIKRGRNGDAVPVSKSVRSTTQSVSRGSFGKRFDSEPNPLQSVFEKQIRQQRKGG